MSDVTQPEGTGYVQAAGASGPRAGFWQRFGAALIDGLILLVIDVVVRALVSSVGLYYVLGLAITWAYYILQEGGPRGQTLGKRALGIRVYDFRAGGPIGYPRALIRMAVRYVSAIAIFVGYLWMLWDREKQCWHDKAANDVVVPVDAYPV